MRPWLALAALLPGPALACGSCRPLVMARIASEAFWPTLAALSVPAAVLAAVAALLWRRP
jgi:hypothetical protein